MAKTSNYTLLLTFLILAACKGPSVNPALNSPAEKDSIPTPPPIPGVDSTAPMVTFHQKPNGISNQTNYVITFSVSDDQSGVDKVECTLNGQPYSPCVSPVDLKNLGDGDQEFEIKASDKKGNKSSGQKAKWTVDLSGPEITLKKTPDNPTLDTIAEFTFNVSNDRSGVDAVYCSLDQGAFAECKSPVTYENLARANHNFSVYARDKSGNDGVVVSFDWSVDPLPPLPETSYTLVYTKPNANGWFPKISPDGRYIAYGFGGSWVYDRQTKQEFDLNHVANVYCNEWIRTNVLTQCQSITNTTMNRYEIDMTNPTPVLMSDDPSLVAGNYFWANEGNWASWLGGRIAMNNQVLYSSGIGAFGMSKNWYFFTEPDNAVMHVYRDGQKMHDNPVKTPLHESRMWGGYIAYGGYAGGVRGLDPSGKDQDLTAVPWRFEGPGAVSVNGEPWVVSNSWDDARQDGYVLIRPWGAKVVMIIHLQLINSTAVQAGNELIVAGNTDQGQLYVVRVPINSQRFVISQ